MTEITRRPIILIYLLPWDQNTSATCEGGRRCGVSLGWTACDQSFDASAAEGDAATDESESSSKAIALFFGDLEDEFEDQVLDTLIHDFPPKSPFSTFFGFVWKVADRSVGRSVCIKNATITE